jgi:H+-translocating NAD(P) transhydrogenase subunit alpha
MIVGVPAETYPGERRVAITPLSTAPLVKAGVEVRIQAGAGDAAGYPDADYEHHRCRIVPSRADAFASDVLFQVRTPGANPAQGNADLSSYRAGQLVCGFADPLLAHDANQAVAKTQATLLAIELIPRISRAQSMDALSSQASLAGYRAVLLAAQHLRKIFPMMVTAAGTLQPARVFVLGAGVAGLQAIATAKRLGAMVSAFDVRTAVKDEVRSLGARFIELPLESAEGAGGYAKEQSTEQVRRQQELLARHAAESDVVITTAAIPGRRSPLLLTAAAVAGMRPGSVIVDLAAERGGNCEVTKADQEVSYQGVTVLGPTNLPSEVAYHASQAYSNNLVKLLQLLLTKDGRLNLDPKDEVIAGCLVCRDGQVVHPAVRRAMNLPDITAVASPA